MEDEEIDPTNYKPGYLAEERLRSYGNEWLITSHHGADLKGISCRIFLLKMGVSASFSLSYLLLYECLIKPANVGTQNLSLVH